MHYRLNKDSPNYDPNAVDHRVMQIKLFYTSLDTYALSRVAEGRHAELGAAKLLCLRVELRCHVDVDTANKFSLS